MPLNDLPFSELDTCAANDTLDLAAHNMQHNGVVAVIDVDDGGTVVGVITHVEVAAAAASGSHLASLYVHQVMSPPVFCSADTPLEQALAELARSGREVLLVGDARAVEGWLHVCDLAAEVLDGHEIDERARVAHPLQDTH